MVSPLISGCSSILNRSAYKAQPLPGSNSGWAGSGGIPFFILDEKLEWTVIGKPNYAQVVKSP